jgi:hypothetical protein
MKTSNLILKLAAASSEIQDQIRSRSFPSDRVQYRRISLHHAKAFIKNGLESGNPVVSEGSPTERVPCRSFANLTHAVCAKQMSSVSSSDKTGETCIQASLSLDESDLPQFLLDRVAEFNGDAV